MTERCPKYPSLPREFCSHCQGTSLGTAENPRFSIKEDFDGAHGYPVLEVLKNGGPIHVRDSHFRFGRRKAEMLLASLPAVREFGWCTEEKRLAFESRIIQDQEFSLVMRVYVEMFPDFEYSTGETIERPWLCLQAMPPETARLGLGMMKCRAVWEAREPLRDWVRRQRGFA